jgi:hypothetical protein
MTQTSTTGLLKVEALPSGRHGREKAQEALRTVRNETVGEIGGDPVQMTPADAVSI